MTGWLGSGLRRDVCIALYGLDEPTAQQLKAAVEDRYGERIEPKRFRSALSKLVDLGHVEEHVDGIHDRYALTDAGRAALEDHHDWFHGQVAGDAGNGSSEDGSIEGGASGD